MASFQQADVGAHSALAFGDIASSNTNLGSQSSDGLVGWFIDDRKDSELATIMGAALDEVVSPDMTRIFRAQPDARAIIEP